MKLLGKWYKCQAEQTKKELRGDFDLSRRENPGKTMMPILHWLCADPTKLIIKASLSAPTQLFFNPVANCGALQEQYQ